MTAAGLGFNFFSNIASILLNRRFFPKVISTLGKKLFKAFFALIRGEFKRLTVKGNGLKSSGARLFFLDPHGPSETHFFRLFLNF